LSQVVDVIIPALDEEQSIGRVLGDIPGQLVRSILVVDNGSTDRTAAVAGSLGASVITEPRRGYGSACLAGIRHAASLQPPADILVFLDADYSDHPDQLGQVLEPILAGRADLVIGSRVLGSREPGALLPQARFGNMVAAVLIRLLYQVRITDLGPFRAIRTTALEALEMRDTDFGWTVEMQVKAARAGFAVEEVPVSYRRRIGKSKITGTLAGSTRAGWKILSTIFRYARS
jgi:glycosyltransferase involved in cell wall biosynthesis